MKRKSLLERIGDVMAGKGFYIVLFLCVAAIGISGYYLISGFEFGGAGAPVAGGAQVVIEPSPSARVPEVRATQTPAPTATPKPTAAPSPNASAAPTAKPTAAPAPKKAVFTWPVKGEVVSGFSLEVLAYDETMGDWRTHSGIDIAAELGTSVLAMTDGKVESVYQDDLMGTTVVISHEGGLKSVYANLAATPAVKAGDSVSTGSVIGAVGSTAIAESNRVSHLHLELIQDGKAVDPEDFLP
ncbi:hypothetical protein SDC9_115491 [bioreactor metagenome]|uniref:M23ase beta-sheet core domain-containing protein n=1 Tax=bioreactor metagenome TaxID=1076179 RepID=A0A645BU05_9ZZZZ